MFPGALKRSEMDGVGWEVYLGRKILLYYGEGALELWAGGQAILMLISVLFPTLLLEQHRIHVSSTGPLLEKRGCFLNPFDARNQYS